MKENSIPKITIKSMYLKQFTNGIQFETKDVSFEKSDIILLVGSNNAGKSRFLKDIQSRILQNDFNNKPVTYDDISFERNQYSRANIANFVRDYFYRNEQGNYNFQIGNFSWPLNDISINDVPYEDSYYDKCFFTFLSTENRLLLSKAVSGGMTFDQQTLWIMKCLDKNKQALENLNKTLTSIFDKSVDIYEEYTDNSFLKKMKVGNTSEITKIVNLNKWEHLDKIKNFEDLSDQGDGIRSAFAILASLISSPHHLFLIDEPETFLHPPQAHALGKAIASLSKGKQCFISTHNIDFIKGLIEANDERVRIFKIDRIENNNVFSELNKNILANIVNDRNLRFSNLLNCLFYEKVALCEDESDCRFYSNILDSINSEVRDNILFCGVGGKDHFKKIIPLMKQLHSRYSVIADIDFVNNRDKLESLLQSIDNNGITPIENDFTEFNKLWNERLEQEPIKIVDLKKQINTILSRTKEEVLTNEIKNEIKDCLKVTQKFTKVKKGGRSVLPSEALDYFDKIIAFLKQKNIFILTSGEIESLIKSNNINLHGKGWVDEVFRNYPDLNDAIYDEAKAFVLEVFYEDLQKHGIKSADNFNDSNHVMIEDENYIKEVNQKRFLCSYRRRENRRYKKY